jgi:hypothetical protein
VWAAYAIIMREAINDFCRNLFQQKYQVVRICEETIVCSHLRARSCMLLLSQSPTETDDDMDLFDAAPTNYQAFALLMHNESHAKVLAVIRGLGLDPRQNWIGDNATLHEILRPIVAPAPCASAPPAPETPNSPSDSEESDEGRRVSTSRSRSPRRHLCTSRSRSPFNGKRHIRLPKFEETFTGKANENAPTIWRRYCEAFNRKNNRPTAEYQQSDEYKREAWLSFITNVCQGRAGEICDAMLNHGVVHTFDEKNGFPLHTYPPTHPAATAKSLSTWFFAKFPETPQHIQAENDLLDKTKTQQKASETAINFLHWLEPMLGKTGQNDPHTLFQTLEMNLNDKYANTLRTHMADIMTQQFWLDKIAHQLAVYLDQKPSSAKTIGDILYADEQCLPLRYLSTLTTIKRQSLIFQTRLILP